jgi:hypothetical protein
LRSFLLLALLQVILGISVQAQSVTQANEQAREAWVDDNRMQEVRMVGCTYNAAGFAKTMLYIVCDDDGYNTLTRVQFRSGQNSTAVRTLAQLGFVAMHVTTRAATVVSGAADVYYLITPNGLAKPDPELIPINPTPQGRRDFVELLYGPARDNRGCHIAASGSDADLLYVSCSNTTDAYLNKVVAPSNSKFALNLRNRGFKEVVFGNDTSFWPITVGVDRLTLQPPISSDELLRRFGIKSPALLAKEDARDDEYQQFVSATVRQLLDFAAERKYKAIHSSSKHTEDPNAWRYPVDDREKAFSAELQKKQARLFGEDERSLSKDLEAEAKTLYNGGKWEPYAGDMARFYIAVSPGDKRAPQLEDLLHEIHAVLYLCEKDYCY